MKLFFVRHAETIANVTNVYTHETESIFSQRGLQQIEVLTDELKKFNFDAVIVSPTWRTQQTILPYLSYKNGSIIAEIWPELTECCWQTDQDAAPTCENGLKIPENRNIIKLESNVFFKYRDNDSIKEYDWLNKTYSDGLIQSKIVSKMIQQKFANSNVLIVTHSVCGFHVTKQLTGNGIWLPNAKIIIPF